MYIYSLFTCTCFFMKCHIYMYPRWYVSFTYPTFLANTHSFSILKSSTLCIVYGETFCACHPTWMNTETSLSYRSLCTVCYRFFMFSSFWSFFCIFVRVCVEMSTRVNKWLNSVLIVSVYSDLIEKCIIPFFSRFCSLSLNIPWTFAHLTSLNQPSICPKWSDNGSATGPKSAKMYHRIFFLIKWYNMFLLLLLTKKNLLIRITFIIFINVHFSFFLALFLFSWKFLCLLEL